MVNGERNNGIMELYILYKSRINNISFLRSYSFIQTQLLNYYYYYFLKFSSWVNYVYKSRY